MTHCPPARVNDSPTDPAHVGIDAPRPRSDMHAPRILIHGHIYPKSQVNAYGTTRIEYIRGARITEL